MKKYHLISNAHLDPVWQWDWEEGAAAALSTFRCAARFCNEFDGYIFCHNESLLYRWVEEYEPSLFSEIQRLVKLGKWHIIGGWHDQPDCNMPSGEAFTRQITEGRRYFAEKFGVEPTTAINFDSFGHTRGLVQILAKSGYDSYLFCRPAAVNTQLPAETFRWVGYDGSTVMAHRSAEGYGTHMGHAVDAVRGAENRDFGDGLNVKLWGVGNHGGGPSRVDIAALNEYIIECRDRGIKVVHSTPEAYFADVKTRKTPLPNYDSDLNVHAPGCYTSHVRIKQKYRLLENTLFSVEKAYSHLVSLGKAEYPESELGEVLYDLLTVQFHDVLPGTSIQPGEEFALRMLDHGQEILTRLRMRAVMLLTDGEPAAKTGEIPILVYNPHPYPVEEDVVCEYMLADQNWSGSFFMPEVYHNGKKLPSQCEKEDSNIPLDWRKRAVFHATLAPSSINRFDCVQVELPQKPTADFSEYVKEGDGIFRFETPHMLVELNQKTGLIDRFQVNGTEYLSKGSACIDVMQDAHDAWGMTFKSWREKIGSFTILSDAEGTRFSDQDSQIPSFRVIEDGDVRTVVEVVFGYCDSRARVRYKLSKSAAQIDVDVRIVNAEKRKMMKIGFVPSWSGDRPVTEVAYGEEPMRANGEECVGQKYISLRHPSGNRLDIFNQGTYGYSFEADSVAAESDTGRVYVTLLHSPGYTTHPIADRRTLPSDRHNDFMEQGERDFSFRLVARGADEENSTARDALSFNEKPFAFNVFPSGDGYSAETQPIGRVPFCTLDGSKSVLITGFKKTADGKDYLLRLFNASAKDAGATVNCPRLLNAAQSLHFGAWEVKTYRIKEGGLVACRMDEKLD